jgi:hypothetical protein
MEKEVEVKEEEETETTVEFIYMGLSHWWKEVRPVFSLQNKGTTALSKICFHTLG